MWQLHIELNDEKINFSASIQAQIQQDSLKSE